MRYIIDFKPLTTEQDIQSYFASHSATVVKVFDKFEGLYLVEAPMEPARTHIIDHVVSDDNNQISLHANVIMLDGTHGKNTFTGDVLEFDPSVNSNWWKAYSLSKIDLDSPIVRMDRRGSNATVYILDSGIDTTHPEFVGANVTNFWSYLNDVSANNDTNGHGTALASIVAGRNCGITNAQVKGVKIFDRNVSTKQSDMLSALNAIFSDYVDNFLNSENQGAIVNCSWTIDKNILIENKIQHMIDSGIMFVCAAGNSGLPIDNTTPASMADVLTVGAYNSDFQPCSFSNYTGTSITALTNGDTNHGELDGWAPGQDIYVAAPQGSYGNASGTSMAAGVHSAVLAFNMLWHRPEFKIAMPSTSYMSLGSLQRMGMLDLSDPKYALSANLISTIYTEINANTLSHSLFTKAAVGQPHVLNLFPPAIVEQISYDLDLPAGMKISTSGRLYGIAPEISTPGSDYDYAKIPLVVKFRDGAVHNYDLEIVTYRNGVDVSTLANHDPVLNLKLQSVPCAGNPCEPVDGCFDNCGIPSFCNAEYDKSCPGLESRCVCG